VGENDFTAYLRAIWRKRGVVAVVLLSSLVGTTLLTRQLPPAYEARVTLYPPARLTQETFLLQRMTLPGPFVPVINPTVARGYVGIMESRTVAEEAEKLVEGASARKFSKNSSFHVTARNLMEIVVRDRDPEKAAEMANALAQAFNLVFMRFRTEANEHLREFLTEQLEMAKRDVEVAEDALLQFERDRGLILPDEEFSRLVADMSRIRAERNDTEIRIAEIDRNLWRVRASSNDSSLVDISEEVAVDDPTVQRLRSRLAELQIELARMLTGHTEAHPRVVALRAELQEATVALREQTMIRLEGERNSLSALHLSQESTLRRIEEDLTQIPEIGSDFAHLTREIARRQGIYDRLFSEVQELLLQESREWQSFVIVDSAIPPRKPAFPVLWMNLLVALVFGSIGAVFLALFLDFLEMRRGMHIV